VPATFRIPRRSLLDVGALILPVWLAMFMTHTIADADLWGHLRFGSDLLSGKGLPEIDPYSFTADTTWINHEWLSEALIAVGYALAGAIGLNLIKLTVIGTIGWLTLRPTRRYADFSLSRIAFTCVVLFASYTRTQVLRPQLFSVLLFTILFTLLNERDEESRRIVAMPVLFCLWANAHGAWIVGYAVLMVWVAIETIERRTMGAVRRGGVLLALSLLATLVNPYGVGQWSFLLQTVGLSRADITDWVPFSRLPIAIIVIECIVPALAVISMLVCRRRPTLKQTAVIALLMFATYRIGRVDAFLQIAIGLTFAPIIVECFSKAERRLHGGGRFTRLSAAYGLTCVLLVTAGFIGTCSRLDRIYIEGDWKPDREAVEFLRAESTSGNDRLLTWFDWGEYAIWHLSPVGVRVSMDGRRETVYSDHVLNSHWAFYRNDPNAWMYPDIISADRIWLPKRLEVVRELQDRGWHTSFESDISVVLSRHAQQTRSVPVSDRRIAYFPGP
jgi:hypothetical protein